MSPNATSFAEPTLTQANKAKLAQIEHFITTSIKGFQAGNKSVTIYGNVNELFGDQLMKYIVTQVGQPLTSTLSTDGGNPVTILQLSETEVEAVSQVNSNSNITLTKAPRPMNCWIMFRDAKHKELKAAQPELTVKQISSRCSMMWRNLSAEDKQTWKDAAQSAKEEHLRQHPDYKYSPRKPGEKKKRQSRKAKRAALAAAAAAIQTSTAQLALETQTITSDPNLRADNAAATAAAINGHADGIFLNSITQFDDSINLLELAAYEPMPIDLAYTSEALRHERLAQEFGATIDMDLLVVPDVESVHAFRDGADGNATLPTHFSTLW